MAVMPSLRVDRPPKKLSEAVGAHIREVRLHRMLSQRDLAGLTAVRPDMVSRYETGVHPPSVRTLYRMAQVLRVPADCLLPEITFEDSTDRVLYLFFRNLWFLPIQSRSLVATALTCLINFNQNLPGPWGRIAGEHHHGSSRS